MSITIGIASWAIALFMFFGSDLIWKMEHPILLMGILTAIWFCCIYLLHRYATRPLRHYWWILLSALFIFWWLLMAMFTFLIWSIYGFAP
jgi:hypothetical protein